MNAEQMICTFEKTILMRRNAMRRELTQHGLHLGQPEMLIYVQAHPGCSQREMAEDAGVTAASIAASFKRMENAGLIRRRSDTADLRCNRVYITQKGEEELASCQAAMQALNARMLDGLSEEEISLLHACMEKISRNLAR